MRFPILPFLSLLFVCATGAGAQTTEDSLAIVNAVWQTRQTADGIVHKRAQIETLYQGCQHINLVEIPRKRKFRFGIGSPGGMKPTSGIAKDNEAIAALNGSYYNMKNGSSVCFLKKDAQVVDSTTTAEFDSRVTGAVRTYKHKVEIMPWDIDTERAYRGKKGTVLASGPLLLQDGAVCPWDECSESFIVNKHPRSALYLTKDAVVFLTVDGRSPGNAIGVNIPELAHLIRVLGGCDAINLDGGGSTTLWMEEGEGNGVLNCPSDNRKFDHEGERSVSNAIFVRK